MFPALSTAAQNVLLGHDTASTVGAGAGLIFGIQDALTRQTLDVLQSGVPWTRVFSTWSAYALVGAGIVGIWLMQNAFSAAPLRASLPAIAAGEPLAGIGLGIVVFGDRIQISPGMLAVEAGGIAALIVGVVAVARSSSFSSLRKIAGKIPGVPEAEGEPGSEPVQHAQPSQAGQAPAQPPHNQPFRSQAPNALQPGLAPFPRQIHGPASGGAGAEP
jgi:hypothetical protein